MAAPGILNMLAKYCILKNIEIPGIQKIYTGGGPIFLDYVQNLKKVFINSKIIGGYGSTEAEPIAKVDLSNLGDEVVQKTKKGYGIFAGEITGVDECHILDCNKEIKYNMTEEEFEKAKTSDKGEIVVCGRNVLKGYLNGIGDSENKINVNGKIYHRTGDVGKFDENKKLWLHGRIKEPYLNIQAAIHSYFNIEKTAVFKEMDQLILVVENTKEITKEEIQEKIPFAKIDKVVCLKKIPVDKRHSTKVDYISLRKMIK